MRFTSSRRWPLAFAVLSFVAGCTGILGTFDATLSGSGGDGGGDGSPSNTDGASPVDGDVGSDGGEGGGSADAPPPVDGSATLKCTTTGDLFMIDQSNKLAGQVHVFHLATDLIRIVEQTTDGVSAFEVQTQSPNTGNQITPLSGNAPSGFKTLLETKKLSGSIGVLGVASSSTTLEFVQLNDTSTSWNSPATLDTGHMYGTGSFAFSTSDASADAGDGGIIGNMTVEPFFAGNVGSTLYIGPPVKNGATGGSAADLSITNVIDEKGVAYIFTAGDSTNISNPPKMYTVASDAVPVPVGAGNPKITTTTLIPPMASPAQLVSVSGMGAVTPGYGVLFAEQGAKPQSLSLSAGLVMSLTDPFDSRTFSSFATLPTGLSGGSDARWGSNQLMIAAVDPSNHLRLVWYDAENKIVRVNQAGVGGFFDTREVVAASAAVLDTGSGMSGTIDLVWIENSAGGEKTLFYQKVSCLP